MAVLGKGNTMFAKLVQTVKNLVTDEKRQDLTANLIADKILTKEGMALAQLYEMIQKQEIEVRKVKPDEFFNEEGELIDRRFTKAKADELKKAKERLEKMNRAFDKGWDGDMSDVYNLTQQAGGKDKGDNKEQEG